MDRSNNPYGTPIEHIKHIERAKLWAGILFVVFAWLIFSDAAFSYYRHRNKESWVLTLGQFQQNGKTIGNAEKSPEEAILITGESSALQDRGEPRWVIHGIGLLAAFQVLRHLRKSYTMPMPRTKG